MKTLIKNGMIINPADQTYEKKDVLIEDGIVIKIESSIDHQTDEVIDASDCWVTPGLIDVHVHLRDPGFEYKETIATGSESAAKGGFTTVCAMPNTNPAIDSKYVVDYIRLKAEKEAVVNVLPIGAITMGQEGKTLAHIEEMAEAGVCAISEDGYSVMDAGLLKKAMISAKKVNLPVLSHCEDETLSGGVMNAGSVADSLQLKGIPAEAEEVIIARDIILAEKTGAKLHICHLTTKGGVDLLRFAKSKGLSVSAEVCPHHFTLTDEAVRSYDTNTKMHPPLRTQSDIDAIKEGLRDGTLELIATDHAPHHIKDKNCDYSKAANGIVGLETSVALTITELVETGILTPMQMVEKMSYSPAKMLGIDKGTLSIGKAADITIINPSETYSINVNKFVSKSKNSPFHGKQVKGKVKYTIVNGKVVYSDTKVI